MSNFKQFATKIAEHFQTMAASELYRVDGAGDLIWAAYINAFPAGTNPMFRVRTEHDGSYDRNFIRQMGNVISIKSGKIITLWDVESLEEPYSTVAKALGDFVRNARITEIFRTKENSYGYVRTFEKGDPPIEWNHFNVQVPKAFVTASPNTVCGDARTTVEMAQRAFGELMPSAVETVLDLISQNILYRGAEYRNSLEAFKNAQDIYITLSPKAQDAFIWINYKQNGLRIRNTAIGTLLQDLSEGMDTETAIRRYEKVVAPANYKRPTAAVTPKMIAAAVETIRELDLEPALNRRHAVLDDVSVNDVLWADNKAQSHMKDGLTDLLMTDAKTTPLVEKILMDITPEHFINQILPNAVSIDVSLSSALKTNFMSVTAPVDTEAKSLFKWDNNFAWSYNGNITDSIKELVKTAGGNTDAKLRVSLAWYNSDDLDIHTLCPDGHIYYGNKAGILDVDMNAGWERNKINPVENLSWNAPRDGKYHITVKQFSRRSTENVGFTLEVENNNKITQYSYPKAAHDYTDCLDFEIKAGVIEKFKVLDKNIIGQGISRSIWGVNTETFVRVETILNSPNFWNGQSAGNKHLFFILEGCKNPEPCRGIYNEFLKPELNAHSKVFEILGNKTKAPVTDKQLSGVGFSSTKRDSVTLRVKDQYSTRLYKVNF